MTSGESPTSVKSASRTLDIIELMIRSPVGLTARDMSLELDIPSSSLSFLLSTLTERGYLARTGRTYSVGPALERLRSAPDSGSLVDRAVPIVRSIWRELNETTGFFVLDHGRLRVAASEVGVHTLRCALNTGDIMPLHALATGKAILATLSEAELDQYLNSLELTRHTGSTIIDTPKLQHELRTARADGIFEAFSEYTDGIVGFGKAIDRSCGLKGAFGIALPSVRLTESRRSKIYELLNTAVLNFRS